MDLETQERGGAELARVQAETKKLASEASKLDAETRRLAVSNALDVFKVVVTVAGATFAGLKVLEALDWL